MRCYNCKRQAQCGKMKIRTIIDAQKCYQFEPVCAQCWDEVFEKEGVGSQKAEGGGQAGGGTRIIRSTKPMS